MRERDCAAPPALGPLRRSVVKREKCQRILALLPDTRGLKCLDVGADNGAISCLLRSRGGEWHSADMTPEAVASIRRLVGSRVHRLDAGRTRFADGTFDVVVIVDYLEHLRDDRGFVLELRRILRPSGTLIVNVPLHRPGAPVNRLRRLVGLTDEAHGHVRPGYSLAELGTLLGPQFEVQESLAYSRMPLELLDTCLNLGLRLRSRSASRGGPTEHKGPLVTSDRLAADRTTRWVLAALYPLSWLVWRLDRLASWSAPYKLVVRAVAAAPPSREPMRSAARAPTVSPSGACP